MIRRATVWRGMALLETDGGFWRLWGGADGYPMIEVLTGGAERAYPEALAQLEQPTDWRPIATAPRDGTHIWLSDGFFMRLGFWRVVTADPSREQWVDMEEGLAPQWAPVFWMPLPRSPHRTRGEVRSTEQAQNR